MSGPPPPLVRLCAVVDAILDAVENATTSPAPRDLNDTFLGAAYGRAYRCMRSMRDRAGQGEADDALILTRALLCSSPARSTSSPPKAFPLLPPDRQLLEALGLSAYYARVYRLASDVVHYSIGSALDGFVEYPDRIVGGGHVALKRPDAERAEEALALAAITYGEFLERSESVIRHGVTPVAQRLIVGYLNEKAAESAGGG